MDNPQTSTIPTIAAPQVVNSGEAVQQSIASAIEPLVAKANAPLPDMYKQGVDVDQPHLKPVSQYQQQDDQRRPIINHPYDVQRARTQNAIASMSNAVGQFAQKAEQQKQDRLKDKLTDVMRSKTNAENAQAVINDPNASQESKKLAQQVLQANKNRLDGILSNDKDRKQIQKAMDISFVDPEKNKTPEVQAFQKAQVEVKKAGPYNADNPQEAAIAQLAAQIGQPKSPNVTVKPPAQMGGNVNLDAKPPVMPAPASPDVVRSKTPYADAALKKDLPTIEVNPQYTEALKQREVAQAQLAKAMPAIIAQQSKALMQDAKENTDTNKLIFGKAADYQKQAMVELSRLTAVDANNRARLQQQAMRDRAEISAAAIRAQATVKAAEIAGLSREQIAQTKTGGTQDIDKQINAATTTLAKYGQLLNDVGNLPKEQQEQARQLLTYNRTMLENKLKALQDIRAKAFPDMPAVEMQQNEAKEPSLIDKLTTRDKDTFLRRMLGMDTGQGDNKQNGDTNNNSKPGTDTTVKQVGESESDETDNSDEYGNP